MDFEKFFDNRRGESSDEIRVGAEQARQYHRTCLVGLSNGVMTNADMRVAEVRQFCELDDAGQLHKTHHVAHLKRFKSHSLNGVCRTA